MAGTDKHIVILEDDEGLNLLLQRKLIKESYKVSSFLNIGDAQEFFHKQRCTLLIIDYKIGHVTADEFIEQVNLNSLKVPFIVTTGHGSEKVAVEMMKLGAIDYIIKDNNFWDIIIPAVNRAIKNIETAEKLSETEDVLHETEIRFRQVLDLVPHFIYAKKLDGHFIFANKAFSRFFHMSENQLINGDYQKDNYFLSHQTEDDELIQKRIELTIPEIRINLSKGIDKYYSIHKIPFTMFGSNEEAILCIAMDISPQKWAENEIRELNLSLEKKVVERTKELEEKTIQLEIINKAKDDILDIVAHDLRSPLTTILTTTQIFTLKPEKVNPIDLERSFSVITNACHRMNNLINDLLDISKLESDHFELELHEANFLPVIFETKSIFQGQAEQKNITIQILNPFKLLYINYNRDRFWQIMNNLMSNAIKFSLENTQVTIRLELDKKKNLLLSVIDQGIGMSDDRIQRIFDKFTVESRRGTKGERSTGLGMSICKRIVELHHGHILVDSKLDEGSTFTVVIPNHCIKKYELE